MTAASIFSVLIVLAGVRLAHKWFLECAPLSEETYRHGSIFTHAFKRRRNLALLVVSIAPVIIAPGPTGWGALGEFAFLRWVFGAVACALTVASTTSSRNAFLNRAFASERVILLMLGALVFAHPCALGPLVLALIVFSRQLEHPACLTMTFTDMRMPLDMLVAAAFWPLAVLTLQPPSFMLPVITLCVVATLYLVTGVAKASIGPWTGWWCLNERVHYMLVASWVRGWLAFIPERTILKVARVMSVFDRPLAIATIVTELGAAFLLADRDIASLLLLACIGMHAMIFATSGINFWKWIIADVSLLVMIRLMPPDAAALIFRPEHLALCIAVGLTYQSHIRGVRLGWLDTRLSTMLRIRFVGASGAVYEALPKAFKPFDTLFAQHRHFHACRNPVLTSTYASLSMSSPQRWKIAAELEATNGDPAAIGMLRSRAGVISFNEHQNAEFDRFVHTFILNGGALPSSRGWWTVLPLPPHLTVHAREPAYTGQEPIASVRLDLEERWFSPDRIRAVRTETIREVVISPVVVRDGAEQLLARMAA
jgi:hypothetical protein